MTSAAVFRAVRGHDRVLAVLRRAVHSGRLHHASLFSGPEGVGKRLVARALAALLQCETPRQHDGLPDACGECRHCRRVAAQGHPDVKTVTPEGRWIRIEQVREIAASTRFRPYEGPVRVVVIEQAEAMRQEAANALLKTLEEPGGETLFVLCTDQPHLLLPTVRSRCQPVRFGRLAHGDLMELLAEADIPEGDRDVLARLSDGSIGRALALHASPLLAGRAEFFATLAGLDRGRVDELMAGAEDLAGRRDQLVPLLGLAEGLYRDAAVLRSVGEPERCHNLDALGAIKILAKRRTPAQLHDDARRIRGAVRQLEGNVNPRLVIESLLLDLA